MQDADVAQFIEVSRVHQLSREDQNCENQVKLRTGILPVIKDLLGNPVLFRPTMVIIVLVPITWILAIGSGNTKAFVDGVDGAFWDDETGIAGAGGNLVCGETIALDDCEESLVDGHCRNG